MLLFILLVVLVSLINVGGYVDGGLCIIHNLNKKFDDLSSDLSPPGYVTLLTLLLVGNILSMVFTVTYSIYLFLKNIFLKNGYDISSNQYEFFINKCITPVINKIKTYKKVDDEL